MARKTSQSVENNFTKGLITYATGLNFPENAVTSTNNFTYRPYGLVERRLGFDFDAAGGTNFPANAKAIASFIWKDVNGDGNLNILVLQTGQFLQFYTIVDLAVIPTFFQTVDLSTFQSIDQSIQPWPTLECQFAAGNGFLFVVNPFVKPLVFQYSPSLNQVSANVVTIMIRDFDGVPEPNTSNISRPNVQALTGAHAYNLVNQGWTITGSNDFVSGSLDTLTRFNGDLGVFPSNADVWFRFLDSTNTFNPFVTAPKVPVPNTAAPRGHFVLNALFQDRASAYQSGINVPIVGTQSNTQPTVVAFFAGRVWYSGVKSPGFNQNIYFSQIISTVGAGAPDNFINGIAFNEFGSCFQANDPTSQTLFDLLPDDGGVIRIPEIGTVYRLFPLQNSLLIFGSNGIWVITGSQGTGFEATSFSVNKLSAIRCVSGTSFVDVLGYPMWWTREGIYALTVNTTANISSGGLEIKSLTDFTIQQFFQKIPGLSKVFARGVYNPLKYTIHWLYSSTQPSDANTQFTFDSVLTYNTLTNAWYTWSIPIDKVQIRGIFLQPSTNSSVDSFRVKYLTSTPLDGVNFTFRFADEINANYLDWFSFDGVGEPYSSSFTTGYKVHGVVDKRFQNLYLTLYFLNQLPDAAAPLNPGTVASSCFVQGVWDYALNSNIGKQTAAEFCRIVNDNKLIGIKKIKIRGRGRVFQILVTADTAQPTNLIGWSITEEINEAV